MTDPIPELLQFPYSHYNEKARWALDYKRAPHQRRSLLPGPHAMLVKRLTGQTQLPVVRFEEGPLHGSARIIAELERRYPDPPLYPADPGLRERALEIQSWFDDEIGPKVRRALFSLLLNEPGYVCQMFASQRSAPTRLLYRSTFPLARGSIKKDMGITDDASVENAFAGTEEGLDFVAARAGPTGHLVGNGFTVADLSAAALLAPTAMPPGSPMDLPQPRPESIRRWLNRWAGHPGVDWVLHQYRRHRPGSAKRAGRSGSTSGGR